MDLFIKGRQHLRLLLLVGCGPLCLFPNQIVAFFDHQYLCKELNDILDFLHEVNHQGKVASEASSLGLVWPVVPLV